MDEVPVRIVQLSDEQALEWQLIEFSTVVGKSFSLPLCTWHVVYLIDVPGLPQFGYNGLPQPRAMACGPDSRFSSTGNPRADSIEFPTGNFAYCIVSGLATRTMLQLIPLRRA